jgi:hypothetical protein
MQLYIYVTFLCFSNSRHEIQIQLETSRIQGKSSFYYNVGYIALSHIIQQTAFVMACNCYQHSKLVGSYENGNELSVSINDGEFLY